jgi:hypothetical protein
MFPTTQKRHVSPFGSNSQGCIHLLKIIAGITSGITGGIAHVQNTQWYYRYNFHEWEYSVQFFETMVTNV